jgi:hypothetical protein
VNFLYARRHLSTIAERDRRELCYITEVDAVEQTWLANCLKAKRSV